MSAIGFMGSGVLESLLARSTQNNTQKLKQNFAQLGQDLQSGNVSQAESDLAGLQAGFASTQPLSSSSPSAVTQAFNQIAQDLRSGNLTAAQSDYAALQQNLQQNGHSYHSHRFRFSRSVLTTAAGVEPVRPGAANGKLSRRAASLRLPAI